MVMGCLDRFIAVYLFLTTVTWIFPGHLIHSEIYCGCLFNKVTAAVQTCFFVENDRHMFQGSEL